MLIISYSETLVWDSCPRQYYYQFARNLISNDLPDALTTGTKGHGLLQSFYRALQSGFDKEEAQRHVNSAAKKMMESPLFDPSVGDLLKAWSLVNKYIDETDFNIEVAEVENRFLMPLSNFTDDPLLMNVVIGFTPDVVFKRKGDFYTVEDAKFVGRAWSQKKLNRFPQAKLYEVFLRKMGYNVTRSSIRFFNTTTNKITDYGTTMTPQEPEILMRDFTGTVREIVEYRRRAAFTADGPDVLANTRRTMNYSTCQNCYFEEPCTTEAQGKDASKIFKYRYRKNDYDYNS